MAVRLAPNARTTSTPFRAKSLAHGLAKPTPNRFMNGLRIPGDSQQYDSLSSLADSHQASFAQSFGSSPRVTHHERSEKDEQDEQEVKRRVVEMEPDAQVDHEFGVTVQDRIQKGPEFFVLARSPCQRTIQGIQKTCKKSEHSPQKRNINEE